MLDCCVDQWAQFGVGFHCILHIVDNLVELRIIDQLFAEMRKQDRFQENMKRLAAKLRIVAIDGADALADYRFKVFRTGSA